MSNDARFSSATSTDDPQPKTPKRKASEEKEEQTCPNCCEKYDFMHHFPMSSPCGHFLCGFCADCFIPTTCYQCDPPADHEFKLAMELIVALVEKEPIPVKKPKLHFVEKEFVPEEEVPVILHSKNLPFLTQIVNQLDPCSFVKLARTCKTIHNVCFNSKGIKIVYDKLLSNVWRGDLRIELSYGAYWMVTSLNWKTIDFGKYPFVYKMRDFCFNGTLNDNWLRIIRSYLSRFPRLSIKEIVITKVGDWNGFFQFVQDFQPESVCLGGYVEVSQIPDDMASRLLSGVVKKLSFDFVIPDQLILDSPLAVLENRGSMISRETLKALLIKCARSIEDLDWSFKISSVNFGHHDLFKALPFDFEGSVCEDRPLIFIDEDETDEFWILRADGKLVLCWNNAEENSVWFRMADTSMYPPCLTSAPVISSPPH